MRSTRAESPKAVETATTERGTQVIAGTSRIAIFLPSLRGGGAERVAVNLAGEFAGRGIAVDLVLAKAEGPYLTDLSSAVRVVDLGARRVLASVPGLVRYLRRERPDALLSGLGHANVAALWARRVAGVPTRLIVSVHNTPSLSVGNASTVRARLILRAARRVYPWAEGVVAVSSGVADDLARTAGMARDRITVIYNPVVTPDLAQRAGAAVDHPWFGPGAPPVVLGAGRLTKQKDFPTLIRGFARLERPDARLLILGEGPERPNLEQLIRDLCLDGRVDLPGFVVNPFAFMARAGVFALSSRYEGLGNVLIEAMACGCPVVATDCPSGPHEILCGGDLGELVRVGDVEGMAAALQSVLTRPTPAVKLQARAADFAVATVSDRYLEILLGQS